MSFNVRFSAAGDINLDRAFGIRSKAAQNKNNFFPSAYFAFVKSIQYQGSPWIGLEKFGQRCFAFGDAKLSLLLFGLAVQIRDALVYPSWVMVWLSELANIALVNGFWILTSCI